MGGNTLSYYNGNQFKRVYAKRFDHFFLRRAVGSRIAGKGGYFVWERQCHQYR